MFSVELPVMSLCYSSRKLNNSQGRFLIYFIISWFVLFAYHLLEAWFVCLFVCFVTLDIFFIYISNVIPFTGFPSEKPMSPPSPCTPTHPLLLPGLGIPLYWGIEASQDQGPLLHWWPTRLSSATYAAIIAQEMQKSKMNSVCAGKLSILQCT